MTGAMAENYHAGGKVRSVTDRTPASTLVIDAGRPDRDYWKDLWRYRELFYFLAWRDVVVRYKQTAIGIAWAVLRPLLTMVVFTLVFGTLAKLPSGDVPYPLMVYVAVMPWLFFATAVTEASGSMVSNAQLVSKVYFPRLLIPASAVAAALVDFLVSGVLLALLMAWYGIAPDWRIAAVPLLLVVAVAAGAGLGILFGALNVRYRDVRYVIPFLMTLGLYVSPVGFSSAIVPDDWRLAYSINPMAGVIDGFRWALFRGEPPVHWPGLLVGVAVSGLLLLAGVRYFRDTERTFADVI
jgi:lipopolysaccharide transport system permease protein